MLNTALDADSIAQMSGHADRLVSQNAALIAQVHEQVERNHVLIERHEALLSELEQETR